MADEPQKDVTISDPKDHVEIVDQPTPAVDSPAPPVDSGVETPPATSPSTSSGPQGPGVLDADESLTNDNELHAEQPLADPPVTVPVTTTTALAPLDPQVIDTHLVPDDQAQLWHFASVIRGEEQGRYGVVVSVNADSKTAVLRTRDADDILIEVPYKDLRPDVAGKR